MNKASLMPIPLTLLGLLFAGADACPSGEDPVTFRVVDVDGAPVAGVLAARGLYTTELAYTDARGEVRFTGLADDEPVTLAWRSYVERSTWDRDYSDLHTYVGLTPGQVVEVRWSDHGPSGVNSFVGGDITGFDASQPDTGWTVTALDPKRSDTVAQYDSWSDPQAFSMWTTGGDDGLVVATQSRLNDDGAVDLYDVPLRLGVWEGGPTSAAAIELDTPVDKLVTLRATNVDPRMSETWNDYTLRCGAGLDIYYTNPIYALGTQEAWQVRMPSSLEHLPSGATARLRVWLQGGGMIQAAEAPVGAEARVEVDLPQVAELQAEADDLAGGDLRARVIDVDGQGGAAVVSGLFYYSNYATDGSVNQRVYWTTADLMGRGALIFPEVPDAVLGLPQVEENVDVRLQAQAKYGDDAALDAWYTGGDEPEAHSFGASEVSDLWGPLFEGARLAHGAPASSLKRAPGGMRPVEVE